MDPDSTEAHACTVAEVEVDTETGEVTVLSIKSAYEVGRQVNPALVRGQIVGGAWMGMSHALYETTEPYYPRPDHRPKDFSEYLMPGPAELPEIDCVVLEMPSSNGPYGVKGVGEMTANSPIPAIVNAIHDASGSGSTACRSRPEAASSRALDAQTAGGRDREGAGRNGWGRSRAGTSSRPSNTSRGVLRQAVSGEKIMMTRSCTATASSSREHWHEAEQLMLLEHGRLWAKVADEERRSGRARCSSSRRIGSMRSASWATRMSSSTSASRRSGSSTSSASRAPTRPWP